MTARAKRTRTTENGPSLRFSAINGVLLAAGLAAIAGGFMLLAAGSVTAAPLLLVLGFAVLVPLGIIL